MASAFKTPDAPRASDFTRCIRCGLCLNACPTFRVLGEELDSPRGRIYQIAQADAGRLPLGDGMHLHLDQCLVCRACETACPSGVPYGAIIERARAEQRAARPLPRWQRWLLESLLPNPARLALAAQALRFYQRSGLQRVARASGLLRVLGLAAAERFSPTLEAPPFPHRAQTFPAHGPRRARVIFMPGCAQNALLPGLNHATVRVLRQHGCEVVIAADFGCCGALHTHAGLRDFARQLARANIAALEGTIKEMGADAIISNASGCGAALKEYADLFDHGPDAAEWQERARRFSARVQDATEFLDGLGLRRELLHPIAAIATYQDPCHLAHAQHIRAAPRRLLAAIPGLELREMERCDQCCGSAGIYNLQQPAIAQTLLADRKQVITATGASLIVTANPGCMLQLARAAEPGQTVRHVLEMLDCSAGANSPLERE